MDVDKKKKLIFLIGALFVAAMFLSSYGAFGNNNSAAKTTTVPQKSSSAKLYFVANNYTNATIYGYSNATITFLGNSSNSSIAAFLSKLSSNGSISDYIGSGYSYKLYLSNMTVQGLRQALLRFNLSANISATSLVSLPKSVVLYYMGTPLNATLAFTNFSISTSNIMPIGSKIPVHITAFVFQNGTVYNETLSVYKKGLNGSAQ
ncbi:MAG: hypothetical protein QXW10_04070 [Candidatus Micrarchaeaceae archaeon]